jgi:hypothetical protein
VCSIEEKKKINLYFNFWKIYLQEDKFVLLTLLLISTASSELILNLDGEVVGDIILPDGSSSSSEVVIENNCLVDMKLSEEILISFPTNISSSSIKSLVNF